jgi:hypothetical protein
MDREKVLNKIKKCLALSKSSNEHEAAAAMRQAKALMDKYGLSFADAGVLSMSDYSTKTNHRNPPKWARLLGSVVGHAFGCTYFIGYQRAVFVGEGAAPQVAGYSYEVLLRLAESSRKRLVEQYSNQADKATLKRLGQAYLEGWVSGVNSVVDKFAEPYCDEKRKKHESYMELKTNKKINEAKAQKSAATGAFKDAAYLGYREGGKVELLHGVAAGEQQKRIGAT